MIDKLLVILAIIVFLFNFFILPVFLKQTPDNTGTFIGLILLSVSVLRLTNNKKNN